MCRLLIIRAACCRARTWRWRRTETWEITWWEQVPTRRHGINTRRYYALANWFCGLDVQQWLFSKHQLFPLIHWEMELSLVLAFGRVYRTIIETNHNYHHLLLQKRTSDRTFHRLKLHSICTNNQIIGFTIQAKILTIMNELVQLRFKYSIHFLVHSKLCNLFESTTLCKLFSSLQNSFSNTSFIYRHLLCFARKTL